ncbi:hypothetical protein BpHYR1_007030 [Brachionus plicatilis]|uniref:Cathepsin propeptide inhibitor domain-containing protein n=1 Tax=Brachionus plicatilis TaxID=10195 RepID=A0A3M7RZ46_BRAPC|nr:hypothetical protein BpHYR1_007030 [Brachionus plicatilis]
MKIFVLACGYATQNQQMQELWSDFKSKYNKNYPSNAEEQQRFNIFRSNAELIEKHNQGKHKKAVCDDKTVSIQQQQFIKSKNNNFLNKPNSNKKKLLKFVYVNQNDSFWYF